MKISEPQKIVLQKMLAGEQPDSSETYSVDALIRRGLVTAQEDGTFRFTDEGKHAAQGIEEQ